MRVRFPSCPTLACHGRDDGSWRAEPWTPSRHASTGYANPGCFAGRLRDCSPRRSAEHFVARNVRVAAGRRPLLSGLSFPAGPHSPHSGSAGARPVLCERHQLALAPLDRQAARAYQALHRFDAAPDDQRHLLPLDDFELLSGPMLEAWLLKTHFGLLAAQTPTAAEPPTTWRADAGPVLLDVLFRGASWPTGWGVWTLPAVAAPGPRVRPFQSGSRAWGPVAELGPLPLQLLLGSPGVPDAIHRPGGLVLMREHASVRKMLVIGWPDGTGGPPVLTMALAPASALGGDR